MTMQVYHLFHENNITQRDRVILIQKVKDQVYVNAEKEVEKG